MTATPGRPSGRTLRGGRRVTHHQRAPRHTVGGSPTPHKHDHGAGETVAAAGGSSD